MERKRLQRGKGRNPFLFRGPIPTRENDVYYYFKSESQSLLIQRSYSYAESGSGDYWRSSRCRNPFLFRGPIPTLFQKLFINGKIVAIPSYSEVLFLRKSHWCFPSTSEGRNPFLFRGPIPTWGRVGSSSTEVAIPSYSEVLFLHKAPEEEEKDHVAIPSYSEVLFLLCLCGRIPKHWGSQSLLIQRSYSYLNF